MENQFLQNVKSRLSPKGFLFQTMQSGDKWYSIFVFSPMGDDGGSTCGKSCDTEEEAIKQAVEGIDTFPIPEMLLSARPLKSELN